MCIVYTCNRGRISKFCPLSKRQTRWKTGTFRKSYEYMNAKPWGRCAIYAQGKATGLKENLFVDSRVTEKKGVLW